MPSILDAYVFLSHKHYNDMINALCRKQGDGLFLECCREVSKAYPEIQFDSMIVDNCAMQLVSRPDQFDVMLTPNLYGNVIVAMLCGLTGGPGLTPSYNIGHYYKLFETVSVIKPVTQLYYASHFFLGIKLVSMLIDFTTFLSIWQKLAWWSGWGLKWTG